MEMFVCGLGFSKKDGFINFDENVPECVQKI